MSEISVGVGKSMKKDSFEAGNEAAFEALKMHKAAPDVVIVFAATCFNHKQLLEGIISVTGNIPMVGGTTAGEISTVGFSEQSVVLMVRCIKMLCRD